VTAFPRRDAGLVRELRAVNAFAFLRRSRPDDDRVSRGRSTGPSASSSPSPATACTVRCLARRTGASSTAGAAGEIVQGLAGSIWIVFQDTRNTHWFGSEGDGVCRDDGRSIIRFTTKDGLCNDHIRQILEDDSGLEFPKRQLEDAFNSKFPGVPHSPYAVYTTYKDIRRSVWFGTANFGACRYDGTSFTCVSEDEMTELDDGPSFGVRGIIEDGDGKFWFSNTLHRYEMIPTDSATQGESAIAYRKEKGIGSTGVKDEAGYSYFVSAIRDAHDAVWMATYGSGVWRYDGRHMTHYPVKEGGKQVLLFSIHEDRQGVLWLGTTGSGVYRFNGEAFERFRP
jgi:ligand-binding sensor domain-containing protein